MLLVDHTFHDLLENLAWDEACLLHAQESGTEVLRFWEWPHEAVVLGLGGSIALDVRQDRCLADGVPIARRSSGGGTVLLGKGCLLFSLILHFDRDPVLRDVNASYRWILGRLATALIPKADVQFAGICDLTIDGRKFSGHAQQRKSNCLLHHGTILYDFPLQRISDYLHPPERSPEYRQSRSHQDFVRCFPDADAPWLKQAITSSFPIVARMDPESLTEQVKKLVQEKYSRPDWIGRR